MEPWGETIFVKLAARHWALWEAPGLAAARTAIIGVCAIAALSGLFFLRADDDVRHLQSLSPISSGRRRKSSA